MEELLRTNDVVLISFVENLLGEAEIPCLVVDQNMSVLDGSIGILPRRILVGEGRRQQALALLAEAGVTL